MVLNQLQPARRVAQIPASFDLPEVALDPRRVAVLLNRQARKVNDAMAKHIERVVGRDNLFFSRSMEEAEAFAREIVQRGYGTVVCGGGDGTLVRTYNLVQRYIDESNAWRLERYRRFGEVQNRLSTPRFAFLSLGTGNGLRRVVNATDPLTNLRTLVEDGADGTVEVPLIACNGDRFLFGGLGYDSMLLNDYNWLRTNVSGPLARPLVQTVLGYFAALAARTLPRLARTGMKLNGKITAVGQAYYIDPRRGDAACPMGNESTLYNGPLNMLGVGTTPFFGYGLKVFPFASLVPGMMHVRVARITPGAVLANLPAIWRGTYRNASQMFDFLARGVRVELDEPFPFQHSGDDQGLAKHLEFTVTDDRLKLVDFYKPSLPV